MAHGVHVEWAKYPCFLLLLPLLQQFMMPPESGSVNSHSPRNVFYGRWAKYNKLPGDGLSPSHIMPFPCLDEIKEINEFTRKDMNGLFVSLGDGVTHYELNGDEKDAPIV